MHNFEQLYSDIVCEQDGDVHKVGIFPGAFKPPHMGHYYTALNACKNNDLVYIFASKKERALSTQNKTGTSDSVKDCDSDRYDNFMKSDKFTDNLLSINPAECASMTSASALRAAIAVKDKNTVFKNLPENVDRDLIYDILMQSNDVSNANYGHVSIEQTMSIWKIFQEGLIQESGKTNEQILINISQISPVRDTYELVDQLNKDVQASMTAVNLYVGT
jgi:hypothetical protein